MKKVSLVIVIASLVMFLSSCATLFKPGGSGPQAVQATSDPAGAEIIIDGVSYGVTPTTLQLLPNQSYNVIFNLGGEQRTVILNNRVGVLWIVLDIVGGGIPLIVDAVTGAWYELESDQVYVNFGSTATAP